MIAITDHGPGLPGGAHPYYFGNLQIIPSEINGVKILRGVEANIIDQHGNIDLNEFYLHYLDIVLAGFHSPVYSGGTVAENTRALIKVMENPFVDIVVHPCNPGFPVDTRELAVASKELGVPLEINNNSFIGMRKGSYPICYMIAKEITRLGGLVTVGSDAHYSKYIGEFDEALKLIMDTAIKPEQILNTSVEKIEAYLKNRKKGRPMKRESKPPI